MIYNDKDLFIAAQNLKISATAIELYGRTPGKVKREYCQRFIDDLEAEVNEIKEAWENHLKKDEIKEATPCLKQSMI